MRIAITGATGFLGKYVTRALSEDGHVVMVLGRSYEKLEAAFVDNINVLSYETDYSFNSLLSIFKNVDIVIHLASKLLSRDTDPLKLSAFYQPNIEVFENIMLAAVQNNVKRVCQTSSISVYSGRNLSPIDESQNPVASNIYGVSKLACEDLGNYFASKTGVKVTNLRISRLFGFGERSGLVFTNYISNAKDKKPLIVHGTGSATIDYIYVKDVVDAIKLSILENATSGTFNIGSGRSYSIKEIAECINKAFDNEGKIEYDIERGDGAKGAYMNCDKAKKEIGWAPKWSLEKALFDIYNYEMGISK